VVHTALPLHAADAELMALGGRLGMETVAIELVGTHGLAPRAITEACASGLDRAIRVVDDALAVADARATALVVERALRRIEAALVCFSAAADPEGLADVPAAAAARVGVAYVAGAFALGTPDSTAILAGAGVGAVALALARRGDQLVSLGLPPGAIVDVVADASQTAPDGFDARGLPAPEAAIGAPAARPAAALRVMSLSDLDLDPTLIRRRNDLRGVVEPTSRPLVTTTSIASLIALLS